MRRNIEYNSLSKGNGIKIKRRTPREELIEAAAGRARNGRGAHMALEAIVDECKANAAGTLGAAIVVYYRNVSENGLERLIKVVEAKLESDTRYGDYLDWISDGELEEVA